MNEWIDGICKCRERSRGMNHHSGSEKEGRTQLQFTKRIEPSLRLSPILFTII